MNCANAAVVTAGIRVTYWLDTHTFSCNTAKERLIDCKS